MREKLNRVIERLDSNEESIYRQDIRIRKLEDFRSGTEAKIENLIEKIDDLVSVMKWFLTTAAVTLIGFFIWYIQNL